MTAGLAARVERRTPAGRDRTVDALRAVSTAGVVAGHWLVSAVVSDPSDPSRLHGESPLSSAPYLAPASWLLQTLGPFFFAAGYAAMRSRGRTRARRLLRPVLAFAAVWVSAFAVLAAVGAPQSTRHVVGSLVTHPLWFLLAYLALSALTPVLRPLVARAGPWAAAPPLALVALTDALRGSDVPAWWVLVMVPVGWSVPYLLGMALAQGRLPRGAGLPLLAAGVTGGAALVLWFGYPASAVGVPGDRFSNLDPPSLFAMALASAQLGLYLLVRPWLAGVLRRPAAWAPVALLNLAAMTVFLWHQTALLLVTFAALPAGRPRGLLDPPDGTWPLARLLWLPAFAAALAALTAVFHRFEAIRREPLPGGRDDPQRVRQ
ncbi:acyltransferase [Dactylosporangium salmoneum]|uniref:Acyltransferase n=1 Tax=Dactylosporangium salmoneum TaxID=53361 RepID=A0ABN3GP92_9ACTN